MSSQAELDALCKAHGLLTVDEVMKGGALHSMYAHGSVLTLQDLVDWVVMKRREVLTMQLKNDVGLCELGDNLDFILGQSYILSCLHANLKQIGVME